MTGSFDFASDIDGDTQMDQFQNATQTTIANDQRSISIAVTPVFPAGLNLLDADAVKSFIERHMKPLVDEGFRIEVQYGPLDRLDRRLWWTGS